MAVAWAARLSVVHLRQNSDGALLGVCSIIVAVGTSNDAHPVDGHLLANSSARTPTTRSPVATYPHLAVIIVARA